MPLLSVSEVTKRFGALTVVDDLSLAVGAGEIVGLVGPNGAGKTTLFNLITGFLPPSRGVMTFRGKVVTKMLAHSRARMGMARTFQTPQLFSDMSVEENVLMGGIPRRLFNVANRPKRSQLLERVESTLDLVGLLEHRAVRAGDLPYGHQRKLEIARALMTSPHVLFLDEPAAGMTGAEANAVNDLIRSIQKTGCAVVVVDHNMRLIMDVCQRIVVMNFGKVIADGPPQEIKADRAVIAAYLGGG